MARQFLLTSALALLAASSVHAGGVAPAPAPIPVTVAPPAEAWTGFYVGAQIDFIADGEDVGGGVDAEFDGTLYGVFAGYRYDLGSFVVGAEIDYMVGSGDYTPIVVGAAPVTQDIDYDRLLRVGAEVGYDLGQALVYGTAGYAGLEITTGGATFDGDGFFYGIGVDYRVSQRITVGGELLQHEFNDFVVPDNDLSALTVGLNVAYNF